MIQDFLDWKEEHLKVFVGHFFQFLSLLGEKSEIELKIYPISNAVKSDLYHYFTNILSYKNQIEVIVVALESLLKDLQLLLYL